MRTWPLKTRCPTALALLLVLALVGVACGGGVSVQSSVDEAPTVQPADDDNEGTEPAPTPPAADPEESGPADDGEPAEPTPTTPAPSPDESGATEGVDGELLLGALSDVADPGPFRMSSTTGQVLRSSALGLDQIQEADPDRPTTVVEVGAGGDSYIFLDLGLLFAPLAAGDSAVAAALDGTQLKMWISADVLVIDATGYQAVADLNPGADLGPFAPGIGVIDLNRLGGLGGDDLAEAVVGSIVNPSELAARLPRVLTNIIRDPLDPLVYGATADYASVIEAMGADLETTTRGIAISVAPTIGVTVDSLAAFYQSYYASVEANLLVTLTEDRALSSILVSTNLSSVYTEIFSEGTGLDLGLSAAELADARDQFADTYWVIETISVFEFDDTIVITPPTGDFEDRTDVALEFFAELIPE